MCQDLRRYQRQLSSPRRERDLPHPGPHGPGVEPPPRVDRQAGQLRLDRRIAAGGHAVHRSPHVAHRGADARGSAAGHGGVRPHLRRAADRAHGAALEVSQPPGQRGQRHRRGHGHLDPAAQPGPDLQRPAETHRLPRSLDRRVARGSPRTGLPHRRHRLRPGRHPPSLPYRPGHGHGPRTGPRRAGRQPAPHRGQRDPLPAVARPGRGADRATGQRGADQRHLRDPRRERPEGAGPHRAGAQDPRQAGRRRPRGRAQPALPILAAPGHHLDHPLGPGGRQAPGALLQGTDGGIPPPPGDRDPPPHAAPAGQGPAAETHGGRAAVGPRQHRRGDPHHPHLQHPGRGQAAADADPVPCGPAAAGAGRSRVRRLPVGAGRRRRATRSRPSRPTPSSA